MNVSATAYARAGLLGNPSDAYGGCTIAINLYDFPATVRLVSADRFAIEREADDATDFASVQAAARRLEERGCYDGMRLLRAALKRFAEHWPRLHDLSETDPRSRFEIRYETTIPRQAGLAGSSAIIIAALRAFSAWFDVELPPATTAELALAAEVEDLGIAAGPMDRVIQAAGGALFMDFAKGEFAPIDLDRLPPLFIAWDPRVGKSSGATHAGVRERWLRGDPDVVQAMRKFAALAREGRDCLARGDHQGFRDCMDENFDMRSALFGLGAEARELVEVGRKCGAAVKFCGSGGAVVGALGHESQFSQVENAYGAAGFPCRVPRIRPPEGAPREPGFPATLSP